MIDDLLTWDVEPPSSNHYGLEYGETASDDGSVTFFGGKISLKDGHLDIQIFDKAAGWELSVIRYPHTDSDVPSHQTYRAMFASWLIRKSL